MQCVGHAAGHDAAVGDGHRRQAELLDGGLFKNQHKHGGNDRHRQKLHKAQLDAVQLGAEVVHQQNLGGKQKGTAQQLPFAAGQGQAVVPGQAQQIQAHHAGGHATPQLYTGAAAKKHAEHRHQHYIQGGHEPGLGCAGGANAHLLRSRCRKQRDAAADAALYQHLAVLPKARLGGGVGLAGFAQHGHQPQQKHTGQPAAARQKAVRAHVVSAHALRHKSGAPDEGSPHQQQGIA